MLRDARTRAWNLESILFWIRNQSFRRRCCLFASARFASFRIPSLRRRSELLCLAFSPPAEPRRPIFPHRAVKRKFHGATEWGGVGLKADAAFVAASFHWVTATARHRSIGRSAAISAPANQIFPVDPVFLSPLRLFTLIHASPLLSQPSPIPSPIEFLSYFPEFLPIYLDFDGCAHR